MEDAKDWARIKFWESPELLEKTLLHLDSSSILNLTEVITEVCSVILKILESSSVWGELIRKTCTKDMYELEHAEPISDLGKILSKMGNLQKKKELELDLLHLIVERSSSQFLLIKMFECLCALCKNYFFIPMNKYDLF